jgi:TRAP-type C4-dicarboxylate transport system substrate-binding protein
MKNDIGVGRRTLALCSGLALRALILGGLLSGPALAQTTWKIATGYPDNFYHTDNIQQFAKEVSAATQGKLQFTVHTNASLFKQNDIKDAVQAGKIEIGETLFASMVKEMPLTGADSVPFVVSTYEDAMRLWKYQRPKAEEQFAARGLKVLFSVPWAPQGLSTNKVLKGAHDMKGEKVRAQNATIARIAEYWGATAVTDVPTPEVGNALATGKVNALITSSITVRDSKAWQHLKYFYSINAWIPRNVVLVNAKAFASLDAATQDAIMKAAAVAEERGWAMSRAANEQALADMKKNGMKIEPVPFDFEKDLTRLGERFMLEWIRTSGHGANEIFLPYFYENSYKKEG